MTGPWAQRWRGQARIAPAIAALIVNAIIGYALIIGLQAGPLLQTVKDEVQLALFDLKPPAEKPHPAAVPEKPRAAGRESAQAAPSPPSRKEVVAETAVVAPAPIVTLPAQPLAAASPPPTLTVGSGSGGEGETGSGSGSGGSGAGGGGDGEGSGGGGGEFSRARQTGGRFRNADFPDELRGAGRVKIGVRYAINPSGRVDQCDVIEGSGYPEVDTMTCRIIMERYRFRPARDPDGYAVSEVREEDYRWTVR
ncbi:energy transducer TonB [Sphingobium bisphenolivorans]|uniref:energy transducer TonB n=1 Tax=Sphingobium bisphenolivorans TaxID=1335760 RepID=UPI0003A2F72E|nr:energy transducer TonB [Sphingobium bisphenolivorans]